MRAGRRGDEAAAYQRRSSESVRGAAISIIINIAIGGLSAGTTEAAISPRWPKQAAAKNLGKFGEIAANSEHQSRAWRFPIMVAIR